MQRAMRGLKSCCSCGGCKPGNCDCGVKMLKITGGTLTIASAIGFGFAIYLQNVEMDKYHYPYVCSWVFAIIQAFAVVVEMTCCLGNGLVRFFLQINSYLLTSFAGVMYFESVFDFSQCASASAPVTDYQCRASYMTFAAASGMTVAQIIIGLVANNAVKDKKLTYETLV